MSRIRVLIVVALVAAVFLLAAPAAQAGFASHVDYGTGPGPAGVVIADFNRDGKQDLATSNTGYSVSVLIGNGSGEFGAETSFEVQGSASAITSGDFNADGKTDVAVTCPDDLFFSVLLGNGSGGFTTETAYGTYFAPVALTAADFNRDGRTDLAVVDRDYNTVSVLLATSAGSFPTRTDYNVGQGPTAVVAGDLNGDTKLDLVVAEEYDDSILLLIGNGSGGFSLGSRYAVGFGPRGVAVGDVTGDGKNDVVVAAADSTPVKVMTGDGAGHLALSAAYSLPESPRAVAMRDLDADGDADLILPRSSGSAVSVMVDDGAGHFSGAGSFPTGAYPVAVACADVSGDGKPDVVTANMDDDSVSVLLGNGSFSAASIAVVPGAYDKMELILESMGKSYDSIQPSDLTPEVLSRYKALFINCGTDNCTTEAATAIHDWVQAGGCLYASDWSYDYVVGAFPGSVLFPPDPYIGIESTVTAQVLDPGLAWYLDPASPPTTIDLTFDLGGWVVPSGVGAGTTTYLRGTAETSEGMLPDRPLLAGFTSGLGRAYYTAFHNEAQVSAMEQRLLEYLVLMPEAGSLANALRQAVLTAHPGWMANFEGYYAIDNGETTPKFSATPMAGQALTIGANWAGARLRLEVFRPNGSLYTSQEADTGPVIIDISAATISASPGTWTYRLVGVTVPDTNHAVVVASFTPPDTIAPTTTPTGGGTAWYLGPVTVTLSGADNAGGQGVAYTEYSLDGAATWVRGAAAFFPVWKRGGGNGIFTLQFRSADKAGNVETPKSVTVKIDNLDPVTKNDAPLAPRTTDTIVHFTPFDAASGVKETWYSLDGFTAVKGTSVLITASGHVGRHWIRYYSIDNAGNVEMSRWCSVDIAASATSAGTKSVHHKLVIRRR